MTSDVTPKAITHRIAKLRAMATDSNTTASGYTNAAASTPPKATFKTGSRASAVFGGKAWKAAVEEAATRTKRDANGKSKQRGQDAANEDTEEEDQGDEATSETDMKPKKVKLEAVAVEEDGEISNLELV